ncbi:MAG TPA: DUF4158 domain-containing protein [Gemmataceae bacterium]|nr:DUF4158 domain-containing protein [Gemmataceae bacterium]
MEKTIDNPGKRLVILNHEEMDALYGRPCFTEEERIEYFALSPAEQAAMEQLRFINAKIYFILQSAYFKARKMFFVFKPQEAAEDIRFLQERYFPSFLVADPEISKVTRLQQQRMILTHAGYRAWSSKEHAALRERARRAAAVCSKPIYVFRELLRWLADQRIVAPGYSTMQDAVGGALAQEQGRLAAIMDQHVDASANPPWTACSKTRRGCTPSLCSSATQRTSATRKSSAKPSVARRCKRCTTCRSGCCRASTSRRKTSRIMRRWWIITRSTGCGSAGGKKTEFSRIIYVGSNFQGKPTWRSRCWD